MPPVKEEAKIPQKPSLQKPPYAPSAKYCSVKKDFDQEIAKNRSAKKKFKKARERKAQRKKLQQNHKILVSRKDNALERIMLSEIDPEIAKEYRKAALRIVGWEAKKEILIKGAAQKNGENISRYNSELRKYKQYIDSIAPTLHRIVNNLRKEYEGLIHDTIQGPVQKLPWNF